MTNEAEPGAKDRGKWHEDDAGLLQRLDGSDQRVVGGRGEGRERDAHTGEAE